MMMMEINQENRFEWIDKYLENELTEDELNFFYNALENDESLQADLQAQQATHEDLLAHARRKAYAEGYQGLIDDPSRYTKEEYAHFKLIQGILKEQEKEDDPDFDAQEPNFFKKNFRVILAVAALVVLVLVGRWILQSRNQPSETPPIVMEDTTDTEQDITQENEQVTPQDTLQKVITEENPENTQEEKLQIVEEDTSPKQYSIPEYTFSTRLGFAGKGQPNTKQRWILVYPKSPSADIKDLGKTHYLFNDTLRFYGNDIKAQELKLIFLQNDQEYLLVQKADTLEIYKNPSWRLLRR